MSLYETISTLFNFANKLVKLASSSTYIPKPHSSITLSLQSGVNRSSRVPHKEIHIAPYPRPVNTAHNNAWYKEIARDPEGNIIYKEATSGI